MLGILLRSHEDDWSLWNVRHRITCFTRSGTLCLCAQGQQNATSVSQCCMVLQSEIVFGSQYIRILLWTSAVKGHREYFEAQNSEIPTSVVSSVECRTLCQALPLFYFVVKEISHDFALGLAGSKLYPEHYRDGMPRTRSSDHPDMQLITCEMRALAGSQLLGNHWKLSSFPVYRQFDRLLNHHGFRQSQVCRSLWTDTFASLIRPRTESAGGERHRARDDSIRKFF